MQRDLPSAYSAMLREFAAAESAKQSIAMRNHLAEALEGARTIREDRTLSHWHANVATIVNRWLWLVEDRLRDAVNSRHNDYTELGVLVNTLHMFNDPVLGTNVEHFAQEGQDELLALLRKPSRQLSQEQQSFVSRQLERLLARDQRKRIAP